MGSKQDGGVRGVGLGAWLKGGTMRGALVLFLALTTAWASAARGAPEKPAGLDDAGWESLQQAIQKAGGQQAKLTAGSAAGADGASADQFGVSIAVSGNTALVGAHRDDLGLNDDQGSAYVFTRSGTTWTLQAKLIAADGAADDRFGISVALSDDTALVGAAFDNVGNKADQGSAYVFTRSGTTWVQQAKLIVLDGAQSDQFGFSVALDGHTALVGANLYSEGAEENKGAAYVFTRSGVTWTQQARLTAEFGARLAEFGYAVAIRGDTALIGAIFGDPGGATRQGVAYIFARSGTTWTQQEELAAADGATEDRFGSAVALSGDTALVGAWGDDLGVNRDQGSAYLFTRSGTTWVQQAKLTAADGSQGDQFGYAVALDGDTALVGANFDDRGSSNDQGSAYVFIRSGAAWTQQANLTANGGAPNDGFGNAVALSGDTALVGAAFDDVRANLDQGSTYAFNRSGASWTAQAQLTTGDGATEDYFGWSVAVAGDTALVGAYFDDVGTNAAQGSAFVFIRDGARWTLQAQLNAADGAANDEFGGAVALSGDTALVAAWRDDVGVNRDQGSAYVFTRSGAVWTQQAKLMATDGATDDFFGLSLALDGNTALVGAAFDDLGSNGNQGSAYVFTRSGAAWAQRAKLTAADGAADDRFGVSVALDGDTALVGAFFDDVGANRDQGSAYLFTRSGTAWSQQARLTAADGTTGDQFGLTVAVGGNTALIGAYADDVGTNRDQGSAYVFTRSGSAWAQQAQLVAADGAADDAFGISVALEGDTALVGAWGDDVDANAEQGSAYLFTRGGTTWTPQGKLTAADGADGDQFGISVALDGDTALVGAYGDDGLAPFGNIDEGAAYLFPFLSTQLQAISFPNPGSQDLDTTPTLRATASSGLVVTFTSATTSVCQTTQGGVLTFLTTGTCTIHADQAGNATFLAATRVSQSFAVNAVVPGAPTIGTATPGDARAAVTFSAPARTGGSPITSYTVTSNPGGLVGTGSTSPIIVSGLTNGTDYTFTVQATNRVGTGLASAASNRVTPGASVAGPVLRPDRVVVRENGGQVRIDVLANDSIGPALLPVGELTIISTPTRGFANVIGFGERGLVGDAIAYLPNGNPPGTDTLRYRVCFDGLAPCAETTVTIERRALDVAGIEFGVDRDRGRRDLELSGLRALPGARFDAHGLVSPVVVSPSLTADPTPETPFDAGGVETILRTFAAAPSAREWRVFVDARSPSGGDVDLYLGFDRNNNGQADSNELACAAAMSSVAERCELVVSQAANASTRYWVLLHSRSGAQDARAEVFEVPVDRPLAQRQLVATGPGSVALNEGFPVRLIWNDATLVPGQVRGGWFELKSDANTSLGWVPVRIERNAGAAVPFVLPSGVDHALGMAPSAANEGLYIDVPPGMTKLDVTTTSATNVDVYLARVDAPAASGATPTVPVAPARSLATASAVTPSGNESLTVDNPAAGRWYVTPVNASSNTADLVVRATLTGTGPQLRSGGYFNPQRSGSGLFLYPAGSQWAGLWYTYLQDGTTTWYYLQAAAPGPTGLWRGTIFRSAWNGSGNFLTPVGEATVTPQSTGAFTFSYTLDGESGSEAYENFGGGCPTFDGAPLDISGHWFDPAKAGSGYSVQLFPNYEFYTVFGYDARGVPRYLVAERSALGGATATLDLDQNTGACPLCTRTGNPVRSTVGTLTRTLGSGTLQRIQLTGTYTAGVPGTWAANDAVIPLGGLQGCSVN